VMTMNSQMNSRHSQGSFIGLFCKRDQWLNSEWREGERKLHDVWWPWILKCIHVIHESCHVTLMYRNWLSFVWGHMKLRERENVSRLKITRVMRYRVATVSRID